jgi:2,3-bisphosphoglycerate-independent phosphoglycerate mutase
MLEALKKNPAWKGRRGPLVLVIMDGVGYGKYREGDAVADSRMDHLDAIKAKSPHTKLKAHGKAVGLPSDEDMGNSEVGHNAMGCGRVFKQGAALVSASIASGAMFQGQAWKGVVSNVKASGGSLHFIGLFSDGNVHSHLDHLKAMIKQAKAEGLKKVRIHVLLDGRDVDPTSALLYIDPFEAYLKELNTDGFDARIASGGGRMYITMDRYGANWPQVERGWKVHVHGEGRQFASAREAIETYRKEIPGIDDQFMKEFVVVEKGPDNKAYPVGPIVDGDSVVYFNFRGDRALEISAAFEDDAFDHFERGRRPKVCYAGMMEYDGDMHVPKRYLVDPPSIDKTLGEYLAATGVQTLAISETQKYGHVTYFFNGNRTGKFNEKLEDYVEIKSDTVPFEERPWMKCADIADKVIEAVGSGNAAYDYIRLNFPNGDMVGHTGVYQAVICSMEAMDLQLGRIAKAVEAAGGIMILTADHGNSDDMYEHDKTGAVSKKEDGTPKPKTAHSLNPVPCVIYDPECKGEYPNKAGEGTLNEGLGISSIAATCIQLLGYIPPADYDKSVLKM